MVNVTFLGTGSAFCAGRRSNVALLIEGPDFRILAEAGPMIMYQLARANVEAADIDQVFLTHGHGDHALGFPMLALNRMETGKPLHVYAGPSTMASLRILSAVSFSSLSPNRINLRWHELSEVGPDEHTWAAGVQLRTVIPDHPPGTPTLSARWDFDGGPSITFITDTRPNDRSVEIAQESDLLIHEASFSATLEPDADPAQHFHSTAKQAGEIARQAHCKRLALIHLGSEIGEHPEVLREEARAGTDLKVMVPEDGQRVTLAADGRLVS